MKAIKLSRGRVQITDGAFKGTVFTSAEKARAFNKQMTDGFVTKLPPEVAQAVKAPVAKVKSLASEAAKSRILKAKALENAYTAIENAYNKANTDTKAPFKDVTYDALGFSNKDVKNLEAGTEEYTG